MIQNNALLTMLGEKTEENEELRMDLQDVKEMYKTQVRQLLTYLFKFNFLINMINFVL